MIDSNVVGALVVGALGCGFLIVGRTMASSEDVDRMGLFVVALIVLAVVYFSGGVTP